MTRKRSPIQELDELQIQRRRRKTWFDSLPESHKEELLEIRQHFQKNRWKNMTANRLGAWIVQKYAPAACLETVGRWLREGK